ncbi:unnamed protein product [Hyaloperonospora brassicae]|uniref:Protein kinase domain-containing protein n=1 Tax=Hyaloperonospora brassicae TaxID=162125 RepID=A0AAV0URX2_HYABA|nr:unnamed protein product [Hyaloperonospora brassicae]
MGLRRIACGALQRALAGKNTALLLLPVAADHETGPVKSDVPMKTALLWSYPSRSLRVGKAAGGSRRCWTVPDARLVAAVAVATFAGAVVSRLTRTSEVQCEAVAGREAEQMVDIASAQYGCYGTAYDDRSANADSSSTRYFDVEYESTKLLGRGSFGVVMKCRHKQTGRAAAVKMLQSSAGSAEEIAREKQALERLEHAGGHAHIVGYQDAYYHNDFHYIVLEYVPGISLHSFMEKHRTLDASWSLELVAQLASALRFMHAADLVHRDLKPENIMAIDDRNGRDRPRGERQTKDVMLKIIDLGSVGRASQPETIDSPRTTTCAVSGTRCYWPPEVLQCQDMTPAMDMWALGCILYILIAGRHPFDLTGSSTEDDVLLRVQTEPVSFSAPVWRNVSVEIKDLTRGLLDKDPSGRLSAVQLLDRLSAMRGTTTTTTTTTTATATGAVE